MKFIDSLQQQDTLTDNGMTTNSSSLDDCVDLFFKIGAMRGNDVDRLINMFSKAYAEDPIIAMRILFWVRDIRGGAGERQIFRDIIQYLAHDHKESLELNLPLIPHYGRWDDLLSLFDTPLEESASLLIRRGLEEQSTQSLCAKWMPRKGRIAVKLRNYMNLSPKNYRKLLVRLSDTVEQKMCNGEWEQIEFGKLPSVAAARYQKAFWKNTEERYKKYIGGLKDGTEKINAGAVYPYDVIKSLSSGNSDVATQQWKSLPNYLEGSNDMILPVVDVSGSMGVSAGNNPNLTCMDIAVSLGLYISERNEGPFQNSFITFSKSPQLQRLRGSLSDRYRQLKSADWGMNTDIESVFNLILNQSIKNNVSVTDMPDKILILSDMEFDRATSESWYNPKSNWNPTAQQMIEKMYQDAGYRVPKIVYWNLNSRNDSAPVSFNKTNTALISGFSPAIMKSVLGGDEFTPKSIMMKTLDTDRYNLIQA